MLAAGLTAWPSHLQSHLADVESVVLGVWCIYCVISLGVISLLSVLVLGTVIVKSMGRSR